MDVGEGRSRAELSTVEAAGGLRRRLSLASVSLLLATTILLAVAGDVAGAEAPASVAWGSGLEGELGNGTTSGESEENFLNYHPTRVAICAFAAPRLCPAGPYLAGVQQFAAGSNFALALLFSGEVLAWGANTEAQLGDGSATGESVDPEPVRNLGGVTAVAAHHEHGLALKSDATVWSWGDNSGGDLGWGFPGKGVEPGQISGLSNVTAVAAGERDSFALLSNGTVKAWGANGAGQLGDGTTEDKHAPVTVSGLEGVKAIAAGDTHALALLNDGTVKAWGANYCGQLGNGSTTDSHVPVTVGGLSGATAIAGGGSDSYALLSNGAIKSWGQNSNGETGDGDNGGSGTCTGGSPADLTPVSVSGVSTATAIAAGSSFADALLANRTVVAWGNNNPGDLGDETDEGPERCNFETELGKYNEACSKSPVEVSKVHGVRAIGAGGVTGYATGSGPVSTPTIEEQLGPENPGEPGQQRACEGKPVDCATGNETTSETDLGVGGRGIPLGLTRTYNAQAAATQTTPGLFGYGWSATFTEHLIVDPTEGTDTVVQANGSTVVFKRTGTTGEQTAPAWAQAKLVLNSDGTYTYTLPGQEVLLFDSSGRLVSEADRNGNTTTMTRNPEGRLESVADSAGRKQTLSYNAGGQVEAVTDPMGHTVKYAYESGALKSVTEPGEATPRWQFKYDGSHRLTEVIDGRGGATTLEYDSANRVTSQTDPASRTLAFVYGYDETTITNHATNAVTKELFTEGGEPEAITRGYGTALATTESFHYDEAGYLLSASDGNGHPTTYTYNGAGDRTSRTDALGDEAKWTYDSMHDVTSTTTPRGETTTVKRDSHGNAEALERPAPGGVTQTTKYGYDSHGSLTSVEDPLKRVWKYEYNSQGARTAESDPEGDKRTWTYDEDSRVISSVSPRGNVEGAEASKYTTKVERDAQERPIKRTDQLGHETKYAYDPDGNVESVTDANGRKSKYSYDPDNEGTKVEEPNGTITETGRDGAGAIISQSDGNKHVTKYTRNILEQVTEVTDPLSRKTKKEYDRAGNLTRLTDPSSRVTTNKYDRANRLTETTYSDGKTHSAQYEYDADSERTSMVDGTGTTTYGYDQLDRLTETTDGHGNVAKYEYDVANQETKLTYPSGKTVTRSFDNAGRLEKVTDWLEHTTRFGYNRDSQLTTTTFPTGTSNVDKYAYNEADQMTEVGMSKGTETLASLVVTRDNDGQVKSIASKGLPGEEKPAYEYDANNRLIKGAGISYGYDAADNPTKTGASTNTFDAADGLKTGTGITYSYDELGERTKKTPTSGAATTYGYSQAGALTSVERPKEGKVAELKDTYAYDATGLRTAQTISGTTSFLAWDSTDALPMILSDGTNSYIYGPDGLPVEQISSGGAVTYLHHDQQGSTRLLTGSTGTVAGKCTYSAYGAPSCEGATVTPLGFDAQYTNSDTGLIYMRARVYDPATAQFLSVDPIEPITQAPYTYGEDNPLNHGDATGLSSWNPFSESFWTEGNFISESSLNPIPYYEKEIESYENGCGYFASVGHGLEGALAAAALVPEDWGPELFQKFANRFPKAAELLIRQQAKQQVTQPSKTFIGKALVEKILHLFGG